MFIVQKVLFLNKHKDAKIIAQQYAKFVKDELAKLN